MVRRVSFCTKHIFYICLHGNHYTYTSHSAPVFTLYIYFLPKLLLEYFFWKSLCFATLYMHFLTEMCLILESPCHLTHSHIDYKLKFDVIADIMMILMLVLQCYFGNIINVIIYVVHDHCTALYKCICVYSPGVRCVMSSN